VNLASHAIAHGAPIGRAGRAHDRALPAVARLVKCVAGMRNAIMFGAVALIVGGAIGCHQDPPPKSPTPNADLQGEANNAQDGLDNKSGSTVNANGTSTGDKEGMQREIGTTKQPVEKQPAPEPPAPPPKP
jgi:hypothetical protein